MTLHPDHTYTTSVIDGSLLRALYREMNCSIVEVVHLDDTLEMWCDEEGSPLLKSDAIVNFAATVIARHFGFAGQDYWGTVVFTGGVDDDGETLGLGEAEATQLASWIEQVRSWFPEGAEPSSEEQ